MPQIETVSVSLTEDELDALVGMLQNEVDNNPPAHKESKLLEKLCKCQEYFPHDSEPNRAQTL